MSTLERYQLKVFGISVDPVELNKRFAAEKGYNFVLLSDPTKTVATAYGVLGPAGFAQRWTFLIGADGRIKAIEKKVSPQTAGKDLAKALDDSAHLAVWHVASLDGRSSPSMKLALYIVTTRTAPFDPRFSVRAECPPEAVPRDN